jgi:exodeoxyribonuclease-3
MQSTKLVSWNVNGIRAAINKGFMDYLKAESPDILCLQETKAMREQVETVFPPEYHAFWHSAVKKGYSGTAVFSRVEPLNVSYGFGIDKHDQEGRVMTLEYDDYILVNVYTPNSKDELQRLDYRTQEWDVEFLKHVKKLEQTKPVVFCGDLNVAHKEIDLANPKTNRMSAGFTDQERAGFDNIVNAGFIDTFREFEKGPNQYTWWSYRAAARERNVGWRIDYFCTSPTLKDRLQNAFIRPDVMGSDHCPVGLLLKA